MIYLSCHNANISRKILSYKIKNTKYKDKNTPIPNLSTHHKVKIIVSIARQKYKKNWSQLKNPAMQMEVNVKAK